MVKLSLARLRRAQGRADEARALLEAALANLEAAFGGEHPRLVEVLLELGDAARAAGEGRARSRSSAARGRSSTPARSARPRAPRSTSSSGGR
ncbi:MAG: tetratricopeptide repeat protein [Myxococcales bacterium]|nr:tetratricopeptide repeat protein [Myxococcales bacterium]